MSLGSLRAEEVIYDDSLQGDWQNYSWGSEINFENSSPTFGGTRSISVRATEAWGALYLYSESGSDVSSRDEIRFQLRGSEGGQSVNVFVIDQNTNFIFAGDYTLAAGSWQEVLLQIDELGGVSKLSGIAIQDANDNDSGGPVFFVDQVEVGDFEPEQIREALPGPTIFIDRNDERGQISDGVYGLNFADQDFASEIGLPVNRWGGNSTTRYNYLIDTTNLASDFYYENMPQGVGQSSDEFITKNVATSTESMITIGMLGYVAKSTDIIGSYRVSKYGEQTDVNMYRPDHGNGILLDGTRVQNDPLDTGLPVDESFVSDWIDHMVANFGSAANGGVRYYMLDNEPMLWNSTHIDAHPEPASYDSVVEQGIRYAQTIKSADPGAAVMGPAVFGWTAYFYSALDAAPGGEWYFDPQDRNAHGGLPFLQWYLGQFANYESENGIRLLDYLDIHYYPQQAGVAIAPAGDLELQAKRIESTRSLWDPTYVDDSWINDTVRLIPRMKEWIDDFYPGTKLAINEYNFGGIEHINGAITQADVLGIFGREGVDIACMWGPPANDQPAAFAFRMFRNYDGSATDGGRFGETVVAAESADSNKVSAFAAKRSVDGATTVVLINKTQDPLFSPVVLPDASDATAKVYSYSDRQLDRILRFGNVPLFDGEASIVLPANSITTLELSDGVTEDEQPQVTELIMDDGAEQRSRIRTMTIQFDSLVSFVDGDPTWEMSLTHSEEGPVDIVVDEVDESGGTTALKISFQGQLTRSDGALIDGNYQFSIAGSSFFRQSDRITGIDYSVGGEPTDSVYALYGDSDGNRTVNVLDLIRLRGTWLLDDSSPFFASELDFNGDGVINVFDLIAFRNNFRKSI